MKKKVLFFGRNGDRIRQMILERFRKDSVVYEKHQKYAIVTEDVTYLFFQPNINRNLTEFVRKHKNVDLIFTEEQLTGSKAKYSALKNEEVKEKVFSLINHNIDQFHIVSYGDYRALLKEHKRYQVEDVYVIKGKNSFEKIHIFEWEFNEKLHYRNVDDLKLELIKQAEKRISLLEDEMKKEKDIIDYLSSKPV